jgi:hypothetical protein
MVYLHTQNPYFDIFWRALEWEMPLYFMAIWNILQNFGMFSSQLAYIFCGDLAHFFLFWYAVQRKIWQPCVVT